MKLFQLLVLVALVGFAMTQASAKEIESKHQFVERVVGKKLVEGEAWVRILKDGMVEGKGPEGGDINGSWDWKGKFYCRDLVIDDIPLPHDCQTVSIADGIVTFTHKEGGGISVSWRIE